MATTRRSTRKTTDTAPAAETAATGHSKPTRPGAAGQSQSTSVMLRRNPDHYRHAVELNPQIHWVADADGMIVEVGPRWAELIGVTDAQAMGIGWLEALHPDDLHNAMTQWAAALLSGDRLDVEYRIRYKSGLYRWMRARATARRDADGSILLWYGTLEDIDDRRSAEAALQESEQFARSILDSSNSAIEVLDLEGRLIFMNGPGIRIMEVDDLGRVMRQPFSSFWPDDWKPVLEAGLAGARSGETRRFTAFGPTAKGTPKWWDVSVSPVLGSDGQPVRLLVHSTDVTEAKLNKDAVQAAAARLTNVLESTMDAVLVVDRDWRITYMNKRAMAGNKEAPDMLGTDLRVVMEKETGSSFMSYFRRAMEQRIAGEFEEFLPSDGRWYEVRVYGTPDGISIFFRDITERKLAQEQLAHLARHDALTGLANRTLFRERLEESLAQLRPDVSIALHCIDLDDFKLVNDTWGHPVGDQLLQAIAGRLLGHLRDSDMLARLGGDEFSIIQTDVRDPGEAAALGQRIVEALAEPYAIQGETISIGASIGIALAPDDCDGTELLFKNADVALYRAKAGRRGGFCFFEPEMDEGLRTRRSLKLDLAKALGNGELELYYQPLIDLASDRLAGFEALLRWNHPAKGVISPATFIPLAEESGLIRPIGEWVLQQACAEATKWPETVGVAVNLSPVQFRTQALYQEVSEALRQSGLNPVRLELEITESVFLDDSEANLAILRGLHDLGVRIALDDFGTGYSSLSYLRSFPFDKIKIDRSFISDLVRGGSTAILKAVIGMGGALGMTVTAEGVESIEQLHIVKAEGCQQAQGYLFSRPVPADAALELARTARIGVGARSHWEETGQLGLAGDPALLH